MILSLLNALFLCFILLASVPSAAAVSLIHSIDDPQFKSMLDNAVKVQGLELEANWVDQKLLKVRLIQSVESGAKADAILVPSDYLGMDEFIHYSKVPASLITQHLSPYFEKSGTVQDEQLGIPIVGGNHLLMFYNKSKISTPAKTWEEIIRAQEQQKSPLIGWSFMEMFWFVPFIHAFDEAPVVNEQPNLDTQSMRNALAFVWRLAQNGIVDAQCDYACNDKRFLGGETAYSINGVWAYNQYKQALGDNLGVAILPTINGRPMAPYSTSFVLAFPNKALEKDKRQELEQLARLLQSTQFQSALWQQRIGIPVRSDVYNDIIQHADSDAKVVLEALAFTKPMPNSRNMMIIWEVLLKGYTRFGAGALDAQQTSRFMQKLAERSIATEELQ
ncbi:sugar ABC transporter substrate-binding protein [Pseudoalteromonas sp. SSDWG2]|uniref:sugar ABC transporter substrate-binding protein n=1 Tax=Pseudoalteromonas sp. SSDWG2 TaxID=3139391 RepID=UPI003BAA359F